MRHVQGAAKLRAAADIDGIVGHAACKALHFDVGEAAAI